MSFLSKIGAKQNGVPSPGSRPQGILSTLAALEEYLTSEKYPDDSPRVRATLMFLVEDGVCKACLTDRDQGRQMWRSGKSFEGCLEELEEALQGTVQDWRISNYSGKKKR